MLRRGGRAGLSFLRIASVRGTYSYAMSLILGRELVKGLNV